MSKITFSATKHGSYTRRSVVTGSLAIAATTILPTPARPKTKPHLTVGDFKITPLSDGHLVLPADMVAGNVAPKERAVALKAAGQSGARINAPLNVTLIETSKDKILIDVGSGSRFMDTAGKLSDSLAAVGVKPEQVTKVIYTHAHPDHLWGAIDDFDEISYPNASYLISDAELNFWMAKDILSKLPKHRHGFAVGAQRVLKTIKDKLQTFKIGTEVVPGLLSIDTTGHTPGHVALQIGANDASVVILGDALTHPVVSFRYPQWQPASDHDPEKAVITRKALLDRLASEKSRIIGYHLPTPGLGRVTKKNNAFVFETNS